MADKATAENMNEDEGPDLEHLIDDIAADNSTAKTLAEQNGKFRANVKERVERRGYHAGAYGVLRRVMRMSETAFSDFDRTFFDAYQQVRDHRAGQSTPDMFGGDDHGEAA